MKAVRVAKFGDPSVLQVAEVPRVSPEKNEVLIKVAAAGINPGWFYSGFLKSEQHFVENYHYFSCKTRNKSILIFVLEHTRQKDYRSCHLPLVVMSVAQLLKLAQMFKACKKVTAFIQEG